MKIRRWIAVILSIVMLITQVDISSFAAESKVTYDEATVLDQMAEDWMETCSENTKWCVTGILTYPIGEIMNEQLQYVAAQFLEDIYTGLNDVKSYNFSIPTDTFEKAVNDYTISETIDTYWDTIWSEDQALQELNKKAESEIFDAFYTDEIADGVTILDAFKKTYSFAIGIVTCNEAYNLFEKAKNTSNLSAKRQYMIDGAWLATVGCEMSIQDADTLVRYKAASNEDYMKKLAENSVDLVGNMAPQLKIAMAGLDLTLDLSTKLLSMSSKLGELSKFIDAPYILEEDKCAFFNAISNQYNRYTYRFSDSEVIMGKYNGYLREMYEYEIVNIPEDIYGFPVVDFGECFAEKLDITEITIPSTIKSRSATYVIRDCDKLEKVYYNPIDCKGSYLGAFFFECDSNFDVIFGEDVIRIPECFIGECGIESIVFPEGITTMGADVLWNCANLKLASIPSTVTQFNIYYGSGPVISNCENLEILYYNAIDAKSNFSDPIISNCGNNAEEMLFTIGRNVKYTPSFFISNCGMKEIKFPEGMTFIDDWAITGCQRLETITIPSTVTQFGNLCDYIIADCNSLKNIYYNAKNAKGAFGRVIFKNIQSDFSVNFGENVKEIPCEFIENCGLTSITFPEGIDVINNDCLVNCNSLKYVTIPSTVETIGYGIVSNCANIDTIYYNVPSSNTNTGFVISDCGNIPNPHMKVILGDNVTIVPEAFIYNCGITEFTYPEGVKTINYKSLENCSVLESVVIPSTVTAFGDSIVIKCPNLSDIYYSAIDAQNVSPFYGVFDDCGNTSGLEIHFIGDIKTIPGRFMRNCGVISVEFPESVTTIGGLFNSCQKLESVTLPKSITEFNGTLISDCNNLKILNYYIPDFTGDSLIENKTIVSNSFSDFTVTFGEEVGRLPSFFITNSGIKNIVLPENITQIGMAGLYRCDSLETIRFENRDCRIYMDYDTIPSNAVIYGYFDSTAYAYAVQYNREFVLIEEYNTGSFGVNNNYHYKYDEVSQTLTIMGVGEIGSYTDMPNYTVKKVVFKDCVFTGSLHGLLGNYKNSVEEAVFENCNTQNVSDMSNLFENCQKLKTIDMNCFYIDNSCNVENIFLNALAIETIYTPGYIYNGIEIKLPYDFKTPYGVIISSITNGNCGLTIYSAKIILGDVNGDGRVNVRDVIAVRKYIVDNNTEINLLAADIDGNGRINVRDVIAIRKIIVGQ